MRGKTHCLEVWGEFACFTRPEMKVERYSYPVITPSAARGIFDAIYWKRSHGFYWQIEAIELLKPPRYIGLRRNEVKDKAPGERVILGWASGKNLQIEPLWADGDRDSLGTDQKGRTQRQTMALKDVRYRLYAHMRFRNGSDAREFDAQFQRRARQGKCFYQPFFGCREFPAYFALVEEETPEPPPCDLTLPVGWMLYDVFDLSRANDAHARPSISVFKAAVESGVLRVPDYADPAVHKAVEVEADA